MIPNTFEQWKYCIVTECQIELTKDFVSQRLQVYRDLGHPETKRFIQLYGETHLENIIHWFSRVFHY